MLPPTFVPEMSLIFGKSLRKYANTPIIRIKHATMPTPTILSAMIAPARLNQYFATRLGCNLYRIRLKRFLGSVLKYIARRRALASRRALTLSEKLRLTLKVAPLLVVNVFLVVRRLGPLLEVLIPLTYRPLYLCLRQ